MGSVIKGTEHYQVHGNIFAVLQRFAEVDGIYHEIGSSRQRSGTRDGETVYDLNRGKTL